MSRALVDLSARRARWQDHTRDACARGEILHLELEMPALGGSASLDGINAVSLKTVFSFYFRALVGGFRRKRGGGIVSGPGIGLLLNTCPGDNKSINELI